METNEITPPSATGMYPDPVWTDDEEAAALAAALDAADVPEPPSATGQYPDPVWKDEEAVAPTALASEAPPADAGLPLSLKDAEYSEAFGDEVDPPHAAAAPAPTPLTHPVIYRIVREVAVADSGDDLYSAVSADREFETPAHPAHGKRHFGLAYGLVLFTQESGRLGSVLRLMQQRDPALFAQVFGPSWQELLDVTHAATPAERLRDVGGEPLWSEGWRERFRLAGTLERFRAAQNEEAIEGQFRPMLDVALALGCDTDRALAMVYDRVVTCGLGGGLRWVVRAAGPLRTEAQRQHALATLGHADLAAFQATVPWLTADGRFGPRTHAALVGALRRQGAVPLPSTYQLTCQLVQEAQGAARHRLERLRDSAELADTVLGGEPTAQEGKAT